MGPPTSTVVQNLSPSHSGSATSTPKTSGKAAPTSRHENEQKEDDEEAPKVLNAATMSKAEREKVRRICCPKPGSGRLEVPDNIFEMWEDAAKGRDQIFRMWAKSGGVKVGLR